MRPVVVEVTRLAQAMQQLPRHSSSTTTTTSSSSSSSSSAERRTQAPQQQEVALTLVLIWLWQELQHARGSC
jgi:hypothetical protein